MARTVTTPPRPKSNPGMALVGYLLAFGVAVLFLPVLPFLALIRVAYRLWGERGG